MRMFSGKLFCNLLVMAIMIICANASVSHAAASSSIIGSKHDFSLNSTGSNFSQQFQVGPAGQFGDPITEVCVFCHTPHGSSSSPQTNTVLWNRVTPAGLTYTPYSSSTSTTVAPDALNLGKPTGISLMCMSCHDGVTSIAVGTLLNAPGSGIGTVSLDPNSGIALPGAIGNVFDNAFGFGWGANIGNATPGQTVINLSNDHPISFEWNLSVPGYTYPPSRTELRLFGTNKLRIECATCHSVHNNTYPPFLAMANTNSNMCRACHIK